MFIGTIYLCKYVKNLCHEKNWPYLPSAGGSYGRLANEIQVTFKFLRFALDHILLDLTKMQHHYNSTS